MMPYGQRQSLGNTEREREHSLGNVSWWCWRWPWMLQSAIPWDTHQPLLENAVVAIHHHVPLDISTQQVEQYAVAIHADARATCSYPIRKGTPITIVMRMVMEMEMVSIPYEEAPWIALASLGFVPILARNDKKTSWVLSPAKPDHRYRLQHSISWVSSHWIEG